MNDREHLRRLIAQQQEVVDKLLREVDRARHEHHEALEELHRLYMSFKYLQPENVSER